MNDNFQYVQKSHKKTTIVCISIGIIMIAGVFAYQYFIPYTKSLDESQVYQEESLNKQIGVVLNEINQLNYDKLMAMSNEKMKDALDEKTLKGAIEQLGPLGKYQKIIRKNGYELISKGEEMYMKIKKNRIDYFLQIITFLIILVTTVYVVIHWQDIPDIIPGHYQIDGKIDRYGNKSELWILIAISWIMFLGLSGLTLLPGIWNIPVSIENNNKEKIYHITLYLIETMNFILTCVFCFLILYTIMGYHLPLFFILYVPLIFITILCFSLWMWKAR